jgi:hypothetical protein
LITCFIEALNKGSVPNINNTWDSVIKDEITSYYNNSINGFDKNLVEKKIEKFEQEELMDLLYRDYVKFIFLYNDLLKKNSEILLKESYRILFEEKFESLRNIFGNSIEKILEENIEKTKK